MLHGGLAATLLDEAMSRICWEMGRPAISAEMNVRWRKPVPIGRKTTIRGRIERQRGKLVEASARILLDDGTEAVAATGKLLRVNELR
jgi:acyl-coenzyme A thioesterase PaaI-like protein